tara:strand:+ start:1349 stop:1459 length:111 start_codon:yes stop_codon:yes gene_type:complete
MAVEQIKVGTLTPGSIVIGTDIVNEIYMGSKLVWQL